MRGKDHDGKWRTPFDPHGHTDITEGTSWQYSWYVPQDVPGLIALHGGAEKFTKKLDELFGVGKPENINDEKLYGVIGEYWHGNEPSHHIIYLYSYAGQNWKAAERVHQVVRRQYGNKPGLAKRQRRLRPDVGVVHFHRVGVLPGLSRQRLLRDRKSRREKGRDASFQRKDIHHDRREPLGEEHLHPVGQTQREGLDAAFPALRRIEGRRNDRL